MSRRFAKNVKKGPGCWEWQGTRYANGYGTMWADGRQQAAHRLAWQLERGPIPEGMWILHRCDNRACVRLDHLFMGTVFDNNEDMRVKKRHAFGARIGSSKLSEGDVHMIRQRVRQGEAQRRLAREFGLGHSTINDLVLGRTWAHV